MSKNPTLLLCIIYLLLFCFLLTCACLSAVNRYPDTQLSTSAILFIEKLILSPMFSNR